MVLPTFLTSVSSLANIFALSESFFSKADEHDVNNVLSLPFILMFSSSSFFRCWLSLTIVSSSVSLRGGDFLKKFLNVALHLSDYAFLGNGVFRTLDIF